MISELSTPLKLSDLLPSQMPLDPREMQLGEAAKNATSVGAGEFIQGKIKDGVRDALNVNVLDLIAEAWAKTDELKEWAEQNPSKPENFYLAKHDVVSENSLKVMLELLNCPVITDHLSLKLTAKFEGVGVTVDKGCIVAINAGRGAAKAELCYSNKKVIGHTTDWVVLPANYRLKRPLPIQQAVH